MLCIKLVNYRDKNLLQCRQPNHRNEPTEDIKSEAGELERPTGSGKEL